MKPFTQDEIPTRPDNPKLAARRCKNCGQVAGDHVRRDGKRSCVGVRAHFDPEDHSNDDRTR